MKRSLRSSLALFVIIACMSYSLPAMAVVLASGDFSKPSQETSYPLVGTGTGEDGFVITESVEHNLNFGPWQKRLINTRGMVGGGSSAPGEPPGFELGRQLEAASGDPPATPSTSEKP